MEIINVSNTNEVGKIGANLMAQHIGDNEVSIGLATGSSPLGVYRELIRKHKEENLSFRKVKAFLLDEYLGLPKNHPESYAKFIRDNFTKHIDILDENVFSPNGTVTGKDIELAAKDYESKIAKFGPIEVQILGIGSNGHIGFNEPGSSLASETRIKTLTPSTRRDNARFFDNSIDKVPTHVLTQGLGTIMKAKHIVMIATGENKAAAVAQMVEGPVSAFCPASILQLHPRVSVVLDDAAAADLKELEFYRYNYRMKPEWQV